MKTYSSESPWTALCREAICLYKNHKRNAPSRVQRYINELRQFEQMLEARFGRKLEDMDILDIGTGPFLVHLSYFAQRNRVTGIDLDVVPVGMGLSQYLQMWRQNGSRRTFKTVIRKMTGIDRHYRRELNRHLTPDPRSLRRIVQMDACAMTFDDASFDLVHSRSVLHSIPEPERALCHVARILKPGGIALLSFQPYTSEHGSLDPRVYTGDHAEVFRWPHLRKSANSGIVANAYLNKLRISEWREKIASAMNGADLILRQNQRPGVAEDARALQASGELAEYSLEELLTDEVLLVWQKPA